MRRIYKYLLIAILAIGMVRGALFAEDKKEILGTVTIGPQERYAVIKDASTEQAGIYKKGDYVKNKFKILELTDTFMVLLTGKDNDRLAFLFPGIPSMGFEFIESIAVNTFEYWYNLKDRDKEIRDERFKLVGIRGNRAILERDYVKKDFSQNYPVIEETFQATPESSDTDVDELFFEQLQTKYMGNGVWIVAGDSVSNSVLDDTGKTLMGVAESISGFGFDKEKKKPKIYFSSNSAEGVLDESGFSVNQLSKKAREKAGFMPGDVIKSVNGKNVSNIAELMALFFEVKKNNLSTVTVEIVRNNEPKTFTYLIK